MRLRDQLTLLTLAGVAAVIVLGQCNAKPTKPSIAKMNKTEDSLSSARDTLQTNLIQSAEERRLSALAQLESKKREAVIRARADAANRRADSLAVLALATDSTMSLWRMAYVARDSEAKALAADTVELRLQKDSLVADTLRLRHDLDNVQKYVSGVERFNADLKHDLLVINECRIVGPIPCPSRTATMATTALFTTLVIVIAGSRK